MKTYINFIKEAIISNFKNSKILHYYVEDENETYQKIAIYGEIEDNYFWITIIGNETPIQEIMENINITDNRYKALYNFKETI